MKTCFKNINLIDGTGKEVLKNSYIIVEDGMIKEIGTEYSNNFEQFQVVDLEGKYVMPGLIDCHMHISFPPVADMVSAVKLTHTIDHVVRAIKNLEALLKSGVTYIRGTGSIDYIDTKLKKHVINGTIKGPGMHCAGKLITMTGGHGYYLGKEADGIDGIRKAVRDELKEGVDLIKIVSTGGITTPGVDVNAYQLNVDELKAAVEEAHKAGKKICTHSHGTQGTKNSIIAGIDCIEHATILDDEAIEMAVKAGTYFVPTISAMYSIVKNGEEKGIPKYVVDKAKEVIEKQNIGLRKAYEAGVKIAMGTDSGTPFNIQGENSASELELMTRYGMNPMDVIVSATKTASELIGIDNEYGTLEIGKHADFLVLSENPLENIKTIQKLESVYQNGVLVD